MGYAQTWNLDVLFAGGSESREFQSFIGKLEEDARAFAAMVRTDAAVDEKMLEALQSISARLKEAAAFTECLTAQDMQDKRALHLAASLRSIGAQFEAAQTYFDQKLAAINESSWQDLLKRPLFREVAFILQEKRKLAQEKLPPEQEALIADLAIDGYHAWSQAYDTIVSRLVFPIEEEGRTLELSAGQAQNKLDHPDRQVRQGMFAVWEKTWGDHSDLCADALNHLAGFRLQVYKHRGWEDVCREPLQLNRMSAETLDAIWSAIQRSKPRFVEYLERKAKLLSLNKLAWYDVEAPLGDAAQPYTYDEAAELITKQLATFSPKMAAFAEKAFEERWIEAEDRAGKRPGGFCTSFPISKQSRIFMTFSGSASGVSTLAHELGHAFHQAVMDDLPVLLQDYAMNVAETASTLAEMIVSDSAVRAAQSKEEQVVLLDDRIQRSVAFYMNIHARFLFETRFYEARKAGYVSVEQINKLMTEAQREAYMDALSEYHPHFWASKLHFYITDVPFYNFPYTFGYLFSAGLYAYALQAGGDFEDRYIALLRDTGAMTVEELALRHLGVDVRKPDFWQEAISVTVRDVDQFLALTGA
ncbi:oligoendopeptidase [Xylanibacillus composti]|uniref:Oligoendopeptidase n=1 Tax=Xylanibacillus composti TaxID=1572762 RepID=A0A8J4H3V1_9BACL|nr:M3 family oligoendopeptidase [Xylanibacillus composti]MDT9723539.1 oligoendopeptidase [Xylanibacillus composti]GIQ68424.1 oligoendopeptidase [Xylanibacillus composti]